MVCLPDSDSSNCEVTLGILILILILCIITQTLYLNLIRIHSCFKISRAVNVFTLRMAALIPCFSFLSVIGFSVPITIPFNAIIFSISEGIALWSFYKLCICGTTGYFDVINGFKNFQSWKAFPCSSCYNKSPVCCWQVIEVTLLFVLIVRPLLFVAMAFGEFYHIRNLYTASSITASIILIAAMISLMKFYMGLLNLKKGLYLERKFLSIKIIVLVILIENIIFNTWYIMRDINPDATTKAKSVRLYYLLVAIQCFLFSLFFPFFFSTFDIQSLSSSLGISVDSSNNDKNNNICVIEDQIENGPCSPVALWLDVLKIHKYTFRRSDHITASIPSSSRTNDNATITNSVIENPNPKLLTSEISVPRRPLLASVDGNTGGSSFFIKSDSKDISVNYTGNYSNNNNHHNNSNFDP